VASVQSRRPRSPGPGRRRGTRRATPSRTSTPPAWSGSPLDFRGPAPYTIRLTVTVDGAKVVVPGNIGIDRLRAEQASMHTHADDGIVYVEPKATDERPTLKQFFILWGVSGTTQSASVTHVGGVQVLLDGEPAAWNTPLRQEAAVIVAAKH
jgi:hypothetical protein